MKFGIKERIVLGHSLEGLRGNLIQLRIIRNLREEFSFSEEEFKKFELKLVGVAPRARYVWNLDKEEPKEIKIGDEARNFIVERLKELNQGGNLLEDHLDIIDKFPEVEDE